MPIDPRELSKFSGIGDLIDFDRPCARCNYNLNGLRFGGRCPECGQPIHRRRSSTRFADNLTDAPMGYLRTLRMGFATMALGSLAGIAAFSTLLFGSWATPVRAALYGTLVAASMAWWAGLYLVTGPRPRDNETIRDPILDSVALSTASRSIQATWVVATVSFAAAGYAPGTPGSVLAVVGLVLAFISLFGLVPLAIQLSALADWAGDTGLGNRLRTAAWAIAGGGAAFVVGQAAGLTGWAPAGLFTLFGMLMFWAAVLGYFLFLFSVLQLNHMALWAIRNSVNAMETTRRLADRQARHEAQIAQRSYEAAETLARAANLPPRPEIVSRGPNVIPRPDGGSTPYSID